jgi:hypothetical protein
MRTQADWERELGQRIVSLRIRWRRTPTPALLEELSVVVREMVALQSATHYGLTDPPAKEVMRN